MLHKHFHLVGHDSSRLALNLLDLRLWQVGVHHSNILGTGLVQQLLPEAVELSHSLLEFLDRLLERETAVLRQRLRVPSLVAVLAQPVGYLPQFSLILLDDFKTVVQDPEKVLLVSHTGRRFCCLHECTDIGLPEVELRGDIFSDWRRAIQGLC